MVTEHLTGLKVYEAEMAFSQYGAMQESWIQSKTISDINLT